MTLFGPWIEQLEAIAVGRELVAVAGARDLPEGTPAPTAVHVFPLPFLDGKAAAWSLPHPTAVRALAFAGDDLLLAGGDDGVLVAWDVTGQKQAAVAALGAGIRAIAVDASVARADAGSIAVGTADGALHVIPFAIRNGTPGFAAGARHALSDGAILAAAWDASGLLVCGGADGQLAIVSGTAGRASVGAAERVSARPAEDNVRRVSPGGDGGIRALACVGDGRAAIGCGDGSLRLCFLVGDVEATDRSGDHGHQAAIRGLALGPVIVDDAGREQPRRVFTVGEDRVLKAWFLDGNRRPKTIEPGAGPIAALATQLGPIAKLEQATGRLWLVTSSRVVRAYPLGAEGEPVDRTAPPFGGAAREGSPAGESPAAVVASVDGAFARMRDEVSNGSVAAKVKLAAIAALQPLAEDAARELLELGLGAKQPTEVAVAAAKAIAASGRRLGRPAVRAALGSTAPELRAAAFRALLDLEREAPIGALRVALRASNEDVRWFALAELVPLAKTSVVAAGMIADALRDNQASVRRRAFAALRQVSGDLDAIRTALARGTADVRAEALLVLGFATSSRDGTARALAHTALDDDDTLVRSAAFLCAVMQQPRLAARLHAVVPSLAQTFAQAAQQVNRVLALPPDDGTPLTDDELEPLFAALACRFADAASRGAGSLLALRDPRSVGAVLQLTREPDAALRRGATQNLVLATSIWPDDDRLTTRLAWLLDDPEAEVRNAAFDALASTAAASGATAELDLAELALRTSQEDIGVRALQILVRVGAPGSAVAARADALLGDALDDEAARVRGEAFRTLWAWHTADPLVPVQRGAHSRHQDLRTQVVVEIEQRRRAKTATAAMNAILIALVGDPVGGVGAAAFRVLTRDEAQDELVAAPEVYLAAMSSPVPSVRGLGAAGAKAIPGNAATRARLVQLVAEDRPEVHTPAIESLDVVAPGDPEGFAVALSSMFYALRVRAAELCGARRDAKAVGPMHKLLAIAKTDVNRPSEDLRRRAARALADIGDLASIAYYQGLVGDDDPGVREMGARGLATAAQPDHAPSLAALVALLGHDDLAVRSWGGEGLAKLGDLRALPVLAGTQKHDHRPLRIGAIVGFVALGADGVRGMRQGLEDRDREIGDLAFAVIVARDAALAAAGIAPDLLVDAMSSPSPEIRFAAARLFERRAAGEALDAATIGEIVGPRQPDKAADMKEWPPANRRAAILQVVADAIASDDSTRRYAAAQVLAARTQPLTYWREAARLAGPGRGAPSPHMGTATEKRTPRRAGWLRRLAGKRDADESGLELITRAFLRAGQDVVPADQAAAQRLVFGVYAGLVRQAPLHGESDETHRVRRDAVGRLLELAREDAVGADAVLPVLGHAVGDPHHLVRQAAMAALRSLYPPGALAPLRLAIAGAADLGRAAIDELVEIAQDGDDRAAAMVRDALGADDAAVREYAALRLPRLYPVGSAEPQLVAAQSKHADVRLAAVTELATATEQTPAIRDALVAALGSEHADLRLRAAVALSRRGEATGNDRTARPSGSADREGSLALEVLGGFLRSDDHADEALEALVSLADRADGAGAAAEVVSARLDDDPDLTADRPALIAALGTLGHPLGAPALVRLVVAVAAGKEGEAGRIAGAAMTALGNILRDRTRKPQALPDGGVRVRYRDSLALTHLGDAARSPLVDVRVAAATMLGDVDDRGAEDVLAKLIGDREPTVRVAAAEALALRAQYVAGATLSALDAALRGGRRELVLAAAIGLAARKRPEAFQPLVLVAKAGEPPEQERAVIWLGALGDHRALGVLVPLFEPGVDASDAERALQPAAAEALGRMLPALEARASETGDANAVDEASELRDKIERLARGGGGPARLRALTGLRHAGDARSLAVLEQVAADAEARRDVRVHAIEQLGLGTSVDRAAAVEALLAELLSDEDYAIRVAANGALARVLAGDRTRIALHGLGSPHDEISGPAARYLATAGDAGTLVARLGSIPSAEIRAMLREGLVRRGALPIAELDAALRGDDARPRSEAAWIVGAVTGGAEGGRLADAVASAVTKGEARWRAAKAAGTSAGAASTTTGSADEEAEAWRAAMWAAARIAGSAISAVGASVQASASAAIKDVRAPDTVRRASAHLLAGGASGDTLAGAIGDLDREVRAVASRAVALAKPALAATAVRALGGRADATTIAPLAMVAWPQIAGDMIAGANTRAWAIAVSVTGKTVAELVAAATKTTKDAKDPARLAAIMALGRVGGADAKAALEAIHGDDAEDDAIKLAAWKSLKRLLRGESPRRHDGDKRKRGEAGGTPAGSEGDGDGDGDGDSGGDDAGGDDDAGDDDAGDDDDGGDDDDDAGDDDDEGEDDDE